MPASTKSPRPRGRPRGAKSSATIIRELSERLAALEAKQTAGSTPADDIPADPAKVPPGGYFRMRDEEGRTVVIRKKRWQRADVVRAYPKVTFTPTLTMSASPHGVHPKWNLVNGVEITVPSIVKDLHDQALEAIHNQSRLYPLPKQDRDQTFEEALKHGQAFTPMAYLGTGWPLAALQGVSEAQGSSDPDRAMAEIADAIGFQAEVGFPGGYGDRSAGR